MNILDHDLSSDNDIVKIFLSLRTSPKQSLGRVASDLILIRRILNNNKSENLSFDSDIHMKGKTILNNLVQIFYL